jgi:hypothetical protein
MTPEELDAYYDPPHVCDIVSFDRPPEMLWRAECSCGWLTVCWPDYDWVEDRADEHEARYRQVGV